MGEQPLEGQPPQSDAQQLTDAEQPSEPSEAPQSSNPPQAQAAAPQGTPQPTLADLQNQSCPNCGTGVLYVTSYDPNADYAAGNKEALAPHAQIHGAYHVHCAACDYAESRELEGSAVNG